MPFSPGDLVVVTGHYVWCGRQTHGRTGRVVIGGPIVEVALYAGTHADGKPAFDPMAPLLPEELALTETLRP